MRSLRSWKIAIGVAVAIGASWVISGPVMLGQEAQSAPAASSAGAAAAGETSSPLPNQPDANSSFGAPDNVPQGAAPLGRGFGRGQRGSQLGTGNSGGDPLFPGGSGVSPKRNYSGSGNNFGANNGSGSFDWTRFFDDALRSGFQFAAPRFVAGGQGMRSMGGGGSLVGLGDGLLRSADGSASGALGDSLNLASEAAQIERRGLNLTLKNPDKTNDLGVRFSFQESMGHNSLLGGGMSGGGSFGGMNSFGGNSFGANSFGSMSSFGNGFGAGNGFGTGFGNGMGGGKRGGGGSGAGAGSQVSVQFKF